MSWAFYYWHYNGRICCGGCQQFCEPLAVALLSESARFLAADLVVVSRTPPPDEWINHAQAQGLVSSLGIGFPSMAVADIDHMALVSVKAVSDGYPIRGDLQWSREPYGQVLAEGTIPAAGEVWLAPRLFALLDVSLGERVLVGEAELIVSGAVRGEPDATTAVFGFGPRLLMNVDDIPATGVIQPGSRVEYRLLLGGDRESVSSFADWVEPLLGQGTALGLGGWFPAPDWGYSGSRSGFFIAGRQSCRGVGGGCDHVGEPSIWRASYAVRRDS